MYLCRILQLLRLHDHGDDGGDVPLCAHVRGHDARHGHVRDDCVRVLLPPHPCAHRHGDARFHQSRLLMLPLR